MKNLMLILIAMVCLLFNTPINAQKIEYGVFIGGNYNFLTQKCDYEIADENDISPSLSYSVGGYARTKYKNIHLLGSIEYSRINNKVFQQFKMFDGSPIGESKSGINNHYMLISAISTFKLGNGFYLGGGLSGGYLFWSSIKTKERLYEYNYDSRIGFFTKGDAIGKVFTNHNFKRLTFSIPVIVGYEFKRINLFTRFTIGVMNRVKGESFAKEIENPLVLGIGYKLSNSE